MLEPSEAVQVTKISGVSYDVRGNAHWSKTTYSVENLLTSCGHLPPVDGPRENQVLPKVIKTNKVLQKRKGKRHYVGMKKGDRYRGERFLKDEYQESFGVFEKSRQNDQFIAKIMCNYSRRNRKLGLAKRKVGSLAKIHSDP